MLAQDRRDVLMVGDLFFDRGRDRRRVGRFVANQIHGATHSQCAGHPDLGFRKNIVQRLFQILPDWGLCRLAPDLIGIVDAAQISHLVFMIQNKRLWNNGCGEGGCKLAAGVRNQGKSEAVFVLEFFNFRRLSSIDENTQDLRTTIPFAPPKVFHDRSEFFAHRAIFIEKHHYRRRLSLELRKGSARAGSVTEVHRIYGDGGLRQGRQIHLLRVRSPQPRVDRGNLIRSCNPRKKQKRSQQSHQKA